jgi:hypothetical protein
MSVRSEMVHTARRLFHDAGTKKKTRKRRRRTRRILVVKPEGLAKVPKSRTHTKRKSKM